MPENTSADAGASNLFFRNLPPDFVFPNDAVGRRILGEYGAVFVARGGATPPVTVIFENQQAVEKFQSSVGKSRKIIGGFKIELQKAALQSLEKAIAEAAGKNLSITPRGVDSARRSYAQTVELWASRVNPALIHWVGKGKISQSDAERIKALSPTAQVGEILRLEEQGIFFSKDLSKSILYSVAAPGTSQHLSMLAFDIAEYENVSVRRILARHGWFQTVVSDLPHFTYLGVAESELPKLGLKKTSSAGRNFWVPAL